MMGTYFDIAYMIKSFPTLLGMVHITLLVTIFSAIVGILLGAVIAILRIQKVPVVAPLLRVFISFMRGTPFLVQLWCAGNSCSHRYQYEGSTAAGFCTGGLYPAYGSLWSRNHAFEYFGCTCR